MFTSKAMKVFITLYQERSLKAAANKLCLTVPPVSRMLKIAEDTIGEQLFTIERNRITPTEAGENLYNNLHPIYNALTTITKRTNDALFRFSSPQMNTAIVTDILQRCFENVPVTYSTRQAEYIRDDDDVFIDFQSIAAPPNFSSEEYNLTLPLSFTSSLVKDWHESMLLTEQPLAENASFKESMIKLREQGFTGTIRKIDNVALLNSAYRKGEGLCFKFPNSLESNEQTLPFSYNLRIFVYSNNAKSCDVKETVISSIRETLCQQC